MPEAIDNDSSDNFHNRGGEGRREIVQWRHVIVAISGV